MSLSRDSFEHRRKCRLQVSGMQISAFLSAQCHRVALHSGCGRWEVLDVVDRGAQDRDCKVPQARVCEGGGKKRELRDGMWVGRPGVGCCALGTDPRDTRSLQTRANVSKSGSERYGKKYPTCM